MDRMLGFEPSGVGSIPAGPANNQMYLNTHMIITNIHDVWGSVIEFDDPLDFFKYSKGYWRDLIYKRKLLIFKKMNFSQVDYGKFSHHFGQPWKYKQYFKSNEQPVEFVEGDQKYSFSVFTNNFQGTGNIISSKKEMDWHADLPNYREKSFPFRALWITKKPQNTSGSTYWLNIEDCFDQLSPHLANLASRITILQHNWHRASGDEDRYDLIKVHPITGKKSLRLNFYSTPKEKNAWILKVFVDGKELPGCSLIQEYINDLLKYPKLYHSHTWDLHDIAIYDNYGFIHGRTPIVFNNDPDNNERTFYRTNIDHLTNDEFQNIELPPATSTSTIK